MTPPRRPRHFASDNYAGICPPAWEALTEANQGHEPGYGDDRWTAQAGDLLREPVRAADRFAPGSQSFRSSSESLGPRASISRQMTETTLIVLSR